MLLRCCSFLGFSLQNSKHLQRAMLIDGCLYAGRPHRIHFLVTAVLLAAPCSDRGPGGRAVAGSDPFQFPALARCRGRGLLVDRRAKNRPCTSTPAVGYESRHKRLAHQLPPTHPPFPSRRVHLQSSNPAAGTLVVGAVATRTQSITMDLVTESGLSKDCLYFVVVAFHLFYLSTPSGSVFPYPRLYVFSVK